MICGIHMYGVQLAFNLPLLNSSSVSAQSLANKHRVSYIAAASSRVGPTGRMSPHGG